MDISLTGFMGCGKSSVGKILQTLLPGYEYIDLDDFIEDTDGRTVAEIFKEEKKEVSGTGKTMRSKPYS